MNKKNILEICKTVKDNETKHKLIDSVINNK